MLRPGCGSSAKPIFAGCGSSALVVFAVRWLEMLAVAVFAYQRTGSPFIVAMLTMLRMLPMALFGAIVGAVAERLERRTALIVVVISMLLSSLVLALLAWTDALEVWHVALASFVNGIAWTTDNPVRRTMIGEVVGPDRMSAAMSIDVGANNASRMLGPTLGGVLLATVGIGGAFAVSVACYLVAVVAAMRIRHRNSVRPVGRRERPRAHDRRVHARPARPAADRDPGHHRHLQHLRLAVHQHDPGDRPG